MDTVNTVEEARVWFLNHAEENVTCVKYGSSRVCRSFDEAERFYLGDTQESDETDREDSSSGLLGAAIGIGSMLSSSDDSPSFDTTPDPTPDSSFDSGGGDFGGAGAGSDF
jgi:uncharacterized membrane protein YgcG